MSSVQLLPRLSVPLSLGPWLWGRSVDVAVFGGSAGLALALVAVSHLLGFGGGELGAFGFLVFVLGIDVAHVWATLFRTYFDREVLAHNRFRYIAAPILAYAASVLLYAHGALTFWRALAYVAVFHFIRQQAGWVALYRAHSPHSQRLDRIIDNAAIYAATLYPLLYWHANLENSQFAWFVRGDFIQLESYAQALLPLGYGVWWAALGSYVLRQLQNLLRTGVIALGKSLVVATTFATWYVGIVITNSDFDFTVCNVITHGVPYFALLYAYANERRKDAPTAIGSVLASGGIAAFLAVLWLLSFVEELAWDRYVWHDHALFFGTGTPLTERALMLLVPLFAVPQATHYLLDGFLWRRGDTARLPAQRRALGFASESDRNSRADRSQ